MLSLDQVTVDTLTLELVQALMKSRIPDDKDDITPATIPFLDIKHFDSLTALEVLTDFEKCTGLYFSDEIFSDETSHQMRSVHQIAVTMFSQLIAGSKKNATKQ